MTENEDVYISTNSMLIYYARQSEAKMRMYSCGIKLCDKCTAHIDIHVEDITLGPTYNMYLATMSNIFLGTLLIDINI